MTFKNPWPASLLGFDCVGWVKEPKRRRPTTHLRAVSTKTMVGLHGDRHSTHPNTFSPSPVMKRAIVKNWGSSFVARRSPPDVIPPTKQVPEGRVPQQFGTSMGSGSAQVLRTWLRNSSRISTPSERPSKEATCCRPAGSKTKERLGMLCGITIAKSYWVVNLEC